MNRMIKPDLSKYLFINGMFASGLKENAFIEPLYEKQ
jgi:hypothetical protein